MKPIYLEPNEEITSVIDKLSTESGRSVAIVVPKNSTLFQSLVNLKLLFKEAKRLDKTVALVTGDKVGQRLARQVGIATYATLGPVKAVHDEVTVPHAETAAAPEAEAVKETLADGTPVHRYIPPRSNVRPNVEAIAPKPKPIIEEPPAAEPDASETIEAEPPITAEIPPTPAAAVPAEGIPVPAATATAESQEKDELPSIISRSNPAINQRTELVIPWKALVAAAAVLLVAIIVIFLFLPKATVTLTLPAKAVNQTVTLAAMPGDSSHDNTVAGTAISADTTVSLPITATGKKDVGTKAGGTVSIKNCEDTNSHALPAGSTVSSSSKDFTTNSAITIPAGSFSGGGTICTSTAVTVAISASQAGDTYNLSGASFTIKNLSGHFIATGTTSGGTTKTITVLAQSDIDKGYSDATTAATDQATNDLKTKAAKQILLDGAIYQSASTKSVDKTVGTETGSATVTVVITANAIVFDGDAANQKITDALQKQLDSSQQLIIPKENTAKLVFKSYNLDKTALNFDISQSGFGVKKIDPSAIQALIHNSSVARATLTLKDTYQADDVKIELRPSWWPGRLPYLKQAISVEYGFHEVSGT